MGFQDGCKIEAVVERYGLDESELQYETLDDRLLARWTGSDGRSSDGYRTLTEWFNRQLLKRVYDEHGRDAIATRVESDYEALTGDEDLLREEVADDLRADGIDPDALAADMISWSTMRHHLQDCLGGEKDTQPAATGWERESIRITREHARTKVADALSSLAAKDELPDGERSEIGIQIQLACPDCPTRVRLEDALARGYVCRDHMESD